MKKNILSLAALLMASAAVFTACSSDDNITSEQPANPTGKYTMTVQASKGGDATTRALSLEGKTLNATWAAGEQVTVYNVTRSAALGGYLEAQSAGTSTTLKGSLTGTVEADDELRLSFLNPVYSGQDGTLAYIAANCDYAEATVTVASVSDGNITTAADANFANQQAIVKFTLIDKTDGTTSLSASQLVINAGTTDYTITPASTTSEIYAAIPGFTGQTVTLTATVDEDTYTYEKTGVSFTNGQYYEITVKMTKQAAAVPDGAINGVFSVSDSKKVYFSKGNLRYASGAWSFFDNQYDYYTSYSADAWDHFGWSTSSTTYGMNTSTTDGTYSGDFVDWGATMGTGWFTLSKDEWTYLFNTRSASTVNGTANGRYAKAKVNNVQGMILFPDTYTHPAGVTAPTGVNETGDTGWNGNNYTVADWTKMESAGCVFLPAAGYRDGSSVDNAGTNGTYWSATSNSPDSSSSNYVSFNLNSLTPANSNHRYYGGSVRLVRQVTE